MATTKTTKSVAVSDGADWFKLVVTTGDEELSACLVYPTGTEREDEDAMVTLDLDDVRKLRALLDEVEAALAKQDEPRV